ncbi:glycoside hydrolase family 19 protein [Pseudoxanthomonas sp. USHLN014]|uniref:glycoside hydrolase family 19 protein n=1 Tax=Pseudoxanthomonas sp. USHLN014 TaxID=3081297 RepID=UPI00301D1A4E
MLPTAKTIQLAAGVAPDLAQKLEGPMRDVCRIYSIDTRERLAAFIAQCGHESASFSRTRENLNYSAEGLMATWPKRFTPALAQQLARKPELIANSVYGGRLGNRNPGDGWRYIGRGWIQVTGLANYEAITELVREKIPTAPDFVAHPELLESTQWAAMSAGAYWNDHDLNTLADRGDFAGITKRVNGGNIGAADRNARYARALKALA